MQNNSPAQFFKFFCITLSLILLFACSKKDQDKKPAGSIKERLEQPLILADAIGGKPPEIISVNDKITLTFRSPVSLKHNLGVVLNKSPFKFTPPIEGQASWRTHAIIDFIPKKPLTAGTHYKAQFKGKLAFGDQKNVDDFSFEFQTARQEVIQMLGDFHPVSGKKNSVLFMGYIDFAQPPEVDKVKDQLKAELNDKKLGFKLSQDSGSAHRIKIKTDIMVRGYRGQRLTFLLPDSYTVGKGKFSKEFLLPASGVFKVVSHSDMSDPAADIQTYGFRFNEKIKSNMDLSGYVSIEPHIENKLIIEDKYLKLEAHFIPGIKYSVEIKEGFPSELGVNLSGPYSQKIYVSNKKPALEWLSRGIILPTDNNKRIQLRSINLKRAVVSITEVFENNIGFFLQYNHLRDNDKPNNSGYYRSSGYSDLNRVGKLIHKDSIEFRGAKNKWENSELDLSAVLKNKSNSIFIVSIHSTTADLSGACTNDINKITTETLYYEKGNYYDNPCTGGYFHQHGRLSKILISSNIGLTLKQTPNEIHVFAVDVLTAEPVKNLTLELYSYQNQLLETKQTDSKGFLKFTEKGNSIRGTHSTGIVLMRLDHNAWNVNNFEVSGVGQNKNGINIYSYLDRGVHRPGDTLYLSAIIRFNGDIPPASQSVQLTVKNPQSQITHEEKTPSGKGGHIHFSIPTESNDPTGMWTAHLKIADKTHTIPLKIETVKPNRLKVNIDVPDTAEAFKGKVEGTLKSNYLFGTPAAHLKAQLDVTLSHRQFNPPAYKDYIFSNPLIQFQQQQISVLDGKLDGEGGKNFEFNPKKSASPPSLLNAWLEGKVYEKGGSFTRNAANIIISPYASYVGIKSNLSGHSTQLGEKIKFNIVTTDINGRPVPGHNVKISVFVNKSYWWWSYHYGDKKNYKTHSKTYKIEEAEYAVTGKGITREIKMEEAGLHMILVEDLQSGHSTGLFFDVNRWGRAANNQEEASENYLEFSLDKNVYYPGDKATVEFETPDRGLLLFSLEQGHKIISQQVKQVVSGKTSLSFPVTEDMLPNAYVVASLIQPHNQTGNDVPMRIYGIKPIYIEMPESRLKLELKAPDIIKPNQDFEITVISKEKKPVYYTLTAVDEGLLDLTGFETPDPWKHFFQKINLGVRTRDNFDEILGLLLPDMDKYYSIGGGLAAGRAKRTSGTKTNRFIPVVLFQKPILLEPNRENKTKFFMPNYVGSVRLMLTASGEMGFASQEKTIPVKQPLMLLTTAPRVARPKDRFTIPVSVFSMQDNLGTVKLKLEVSNNMKILGEKSREVTFSEQGEKDVYFEVEVGENIGEGVVSVTAETQKFTAHHKIQLPLVPANPFFTQVKEETVLPGKEKTFTPNKIGIEGTNKAWFSFSKMPDIQLHKRFKYLIRYPYGCLEQTVSSAFPQLFMGNFMDLSAVEKAESLANVNAAIIRLSHYRLSDGFSYWPSYLSHYSRWANNYLGHFLLEAKEAGYHVPDHLFKHWLKSAQKRSREVDRKNHRYQAYTLLLLAMAGKADVGAMNLMRENYLSELDGLSKRMLAAAHYVYGQKEAGLKIDKYQTTEITDYRELAGTFGSSLRDRAMFVWLSLLMDDLPEATRVFKNVAKQFNPSGWYSTQEVAMTLLALHKLTTSTQSTGGDVKFQVKIPGGKNMDLEVSGYQTKLDIPASAWGKPIKIISKSGAPLFVNLYQEGIPLTSVIKDESQGIRLTRNFYDEDGREMIEENISQGKSFWIKYQVTSTTGEKVQNLALSSLFPSGWEVINHRLTGTPLPGWVTRENPTEGDYMDIRDDRVNWFFDLSSGYRQPNFLVHINPTFKGSYQLPPVTVEAMYSPDYYSRISGQPTTVR